MRIPQFRRSKHGPSAGPVKRPTSPFRDIVESIINLPRRIENGVSRIINRGGRDQEALQDSDGSLSQNSFDSARNNRGLTLPTSPEPVLISEHRSSTHSDDSSFWRQLFSVNDDDGGISGTHAVVDDTADNAQPLSLSEDQPRIEEANVEVNNLTDTDEASLFEIPSADDHPEQFYHGHGDTYLDASLRQGTVTTCNCSAARVTGTCSCGCPSKSKHDIEPHDASLANAGANFDHDVPTNPLLEPVSFDRYQSHKGTSLVPGRRQKGEQHISASSEDSSYEVATAFLQHTRPRVRSLNTQTTDTPSAGRYELDGLQSSTNDQSLPLTEATSAACTYTDPEHVDYVQQDDTSIHPDNAATDSIVSLVLPETSYSNSHMTYPDFVDDGDLNNEGLNPVVESHDLPYQEISTAEAFKMIGIRDDGVKPTVYAVQNIRSKKEPTFPSSGRIQKSRKLRSHPYKCPLVPASSHQTCHYQSTNREEFRKHLKRHVQRCSRHSDFGYANKSELDAHLRSKRHNNTLDLKLNCPSCGRYDTRTSNLKRHIRTCGTRDRYSFMP